MKKVIYVFAMLTIFGNAIFGQTKPTIAWVDIPAGTFTMGSPTSEVDRRSDEPRHQVKLTVSAFAQKMPDLVIEVIERPKWDNGSRIFVTIKNIGEAPSEPVMLKVYDVDIREVLNFKYQ